MPTPRHPSEPASGGAAVPAQSRSVMAPGELASVCAFYELGAVRSVYAFNRGSRQSPKAILETERGKYLIKRRARGRDDPSRVASSHDLQLFLHAAGFPTPAIIGTRHGNNSMAQLDGRVYEVFAFVEGEAFDRTPEPCEDAGRQLARLHALVRDYRSRWPSPAWAPEQHDRVATQLGEIAARGVASREARRLGAVFDRLRPALAGAGEPQMLHADWHPGNMVFRGSTVAAVLDFDAARLGPVLVDIASGSLQFSMTRVGVNPDDWPDGLDAHRFAAFLRGYGPEAAGAGLGALPAMMGAALVGEVVAPIAATGTFAGRDPGPFLRMVCRKTEWLIENASKLDALATRAARGG